MAHSNTPLPSLKYSLKKRSLSLHGHATSVSLEDPFWQHLHAFAQEDGVSLARFVARIDDAREGPLSGSLRVYVLWRLEQQTLK